MKYTDIVQLAAQVLSARGPLTDDQLISELHARGIDLGESPTEALQDAFDDELAPAMTLSDERVVWLPALLAGRMFTHRLTEPEISHALLFCVPDLGPADPVLAPDDPRLADRTPVRQLLLPFDADALQERGVPVSDIPDHSVLMLPAGYLIRRGFQPNDLVALRVSEDGDELEVVAVADTPASSTELTRALEAVLLSDEPAELDDAVWTACADRPELFRTPLPPLEEVLATSGLIRHGSWIARDGFDFTAWRADLRTDALIDRYDLSEDEAFAVLVGTALYQQVSDLYDAAGPSSVDPAALDGVFDKLAAEASELTTSGAPAGSALKDALAFLDEPVVVTALLAETTGYDADRAAPLELLAEALEPQTPRSARPAFRWLRAKAQELLGQVETAERTLLTAESMDPSWPLTLVDLARYAFDRGDATRGLSLLRRTGAPADHPMIEAFQRYEATRQTDLGRNDPCWCGSGRKYKKCHLDAAQITPDDRARWLYQKACLFVMDAARYDRLAELADLRAQYAESDDAVWEATTDPLVADALLFEGGVFEEFLRTRGVLLPDDEQLLARQWLLSERSVYEVTGIQAGDHLTLRDLRTGDVHQVRERTAGSYLTRGELVCARVAQTEEAPQIFGGLEPVALHQRDELIALLDDGPGPAELVEFLTRRFVPTLLQNTEGDPLVFCGTTLRADDEVALSNLLDEEFDRADPAEPEWFEYVTTDGMQRLSASLRLDGGELHVETNSEERHERVLATLLELIPSLVPISETRKPARDAREIAGLATASADQDRSTVGPVDPGIAAVLEQFVLDYERKWLDDPIPALDGVTPREAANDPTRRDDLMRLLGSFPPADTPGMMSPERLRSVLGLSPE